MTVTHLSALDLFAIRRKFLLENLGLAVFPFSNN